MKKFENVKKGYEVQFVNLDGNIENALVNYVDNKKFSVEVLKYSKHKKEYYSLKMSWFLSGKKTNRFYNYGNAIKIVNKWN